MPTSGAPSGSRDPPKVVLGMMDKGFLLGKDINYSLCNEFRRRGFEVWVLGNRQALEATGLPQRYRAFARLFLGFGRSGPAAPEPVESPGAPPRTLGGVFEYLFSRIRIDRLFAYDIFLEELSKIGPDLFVTEWYLPEMVRAAKKVGAATVLWCLDDPMIIEENWFYGKWFEYAAQFDHVFTFSKGAVPVYRESGVAKAEWLPLFFDPSSMGFRDAGCEKRYPVSFVANRFRDRDPALRRIVVPLVGRLKGSVHVFGSGWLGCAEVSQATIHGPVPRARLGEVLCASKVSLNVHRESSYRFAGSLNYRTFEIPGARCFELMEYLEGVEELFRVGSEIVVARSGAEAVELVEYYLENEEEREKIALQGHRRVMADHTIARRVDKILQAVKLC